MAKFRNARFASVGVVTLAETSISFRGKNFDVDPRYVLRIRERIVVKPSPMATAMGKKKKSARDRPRYIVECKEHSSRA